MGLIAALFAVLMIAATVVAGIVMYLATGWAGAVAFAAFIWLLFRLTRETGPMPRGPRHGGNAFQRWAARD